MHPPVVLRRLFYRVAHRLLRVTWLLRNPAVVGVKCLMINENRVLLVRHTYGNRAWDLPGGGLKRGEGLLDAARREMKEELGVESAGWSELGEIRGTMYHRRETVQCFSASLASAAVAMNAGELAEVEWFDRAALPADLGPYMRAIVAAGSWPVCRTGTCPSAVIQPCGD